MEKEMLINAVIQCMYNVRGILVSGYLEAVYRRALMVELRNAGIEAEQEREIVVKYKVEEVGNYRADIVVDNRVIIEIKAVERLNKAHEVQLVNYLTATGIEDGLLVNFGGEYDVRRKFRTYCPKPS